MGRDIRGSIRPKEPIHLPASHPYLEGLQLTQFRSYLELMLDFSPDINCLTGPNGAGKTNVLDALHYLAFTRGFRHHQDKQAVLDGTQFFFIGGTWVRDKSRKQVHCNFMHGKGKKLLINQKPVDRMSDHIGMIPLVAILPSDTDLINGPSGERRRFLDMLISQYDHQFLHHLIQYDRALQQRNALLKMMAEQRYFDADQLALWDTQLIPHGQVIRDGREQFVEAFAPIFAEYFSAIVSDREQPHLHYRSQLPDNEAATWQQFLTDNQEKDRVNGYTVGGIHRDELVFRIDEHSVRHYGSQGQQKTFVIALKLAQYELLQQRSGMAPLLLLDDLFDKLDRHRLGQIADLLASKVSGQVFITDTSLEKLQEIFADSARELRYFRVADATVQPA